MRSLCRPRWTCLWPAALACAWGACCRSAEPMGSPGSSVRAWTGRYSAVTWSAGTSWARSLSTPSAPPAGRVLAPQDSRPMPVDMRARIGQVELPNLVLTASGCAGAGRELAQFIDVARVGALISKSIMTAPRLAETPSGMLNSVGWQGPGIDAFLQRDLPWLLSRGARVVVSIAGQTIREYAELAARLSDTAGVTAIEVNLACPNAEDAGRPFAFDPQRAGSVVGAVRGRARYDIPVFAKL